MNHFNCFSALVALYRRTRVLYRAFRLLIPTGYLERHAANTLLLNLRYIWAFRIQIGKALAFLLPEQLGYLKYMLPTPRYASKTFPHRRHFLT
jgi:hypothetical protein